MRTETDPQAVARLNLLSVLTGSESLNVRGWRGARIGNESAGSIDVEVWESTAPDGTWLHASDLDFTCPAEETIALPAGVFGCHYIKLIVPLAVAAVPVFLVPKA